MIFLIVGLAAGAASATLSLSLLSGSMLAVLLFMFAPLPILIASMGWNHRAGLVGAVAASAMLLGVAGFETARGYALSIGLPAWWLGYLCLLARPRGERQEDGVDWYPIGRLVLWTAAVGAALVLMTILLAGSITEYREMLKVMFETFLRQETGTAADAPIVLPGGGDPARLAELAVIALPPLGAAVWTANTLFNLWVAGRVVRASSRLARPWPELPMLTLPGLALPAFALSIAGAMVPGVGFCFGIIASALAVAFSIQGLACLHAVSRGISGRGLLLTGTYLLLAVQTWTLVFLAILGIAEQMFQLRSRAADRAMRRKPPSRN
jgi:hypothetical protein